ncbi:outer membrane lipoprotein carrier protein LolA [Fontimonas sp. SYSU GA230001]|uniref:outer membrane lipoprotein carrier protein LolA n=1 Tax=Fontimonas sp. SYSU GA230001 TaxID=3142450 RepID=UPI0032B45BFF
MIRRLVLLVALLVARPAAADVFEHPADAALLARVLAPAAGVLKDAQSLRGRYRQTKQLADLPQPLVAEGDFLFARALGIAWRTVTPFPAELLITPDALVQRNGGAEQRIEAAHQPAVRAIAQLFFAVFTLDFDTLTAVFRPYAEAHVDGQWTLGLRPLQALGAIEEIEIRGGTMVADVELRERGGDRTRIELLATEASAVALSDADRARFASRP